MIHHVLALKKCWKNFYLENFYLLDSINSIKLLQDLEFHVIDIDIHSIKPNNTINFDLNAMFVL